MADDVVTEPVTNENNNEYLDKPKVETCQTDEQLADKMEDEKSQTIVGNDVEGNNEERNEIEKKEDTAGNFEGVDTVTERLSNDNGTDVNNEKVENTEMNNDETKIKMEQETHETGEVSVNEIQDTETTVADSKEPDDNKLQENEKSLEDMDPDEMKRKISECKLKSDTLQIELDMAHAKNLELEDKIKTMQKSRKKSSESMSSTEAREKAKQRDGLAFQADYLARELSQQQDTEAYLREKLTETLEEKEELERKNKDLHLRLKRFTKDDQAKDERIARMEKELQEINTEVQEMEKLVDQSSLMKIQEMRQRKSSSAQNGESLPQQTTTIQQTSPSPTSKTCIIL